VIGPAESGWSLRGGHLAEADVSAVHLHAVQDTGKLARLTELADVLTRDAQG